MMIQDYDEAMVFLDPDKSERRSFLRANLQDKQRAPCLPNFRATRKADAIYSFGRFAFAEIVVKNNILDLVGNNPIIVVSNPESIRDLDAFATEIALFDIECPNLLGLGLESDALTEARANFLDSAGKYWEAKGENFGASQNDPAHTSGIDVSRKEKISALCNARSAFYEGYALSQNAGAKTSVHTAAQHPFGEDLLIQELSTDDSAAFPYRILKELDRANNTLSPFPAAEIADGCG